MMLQVGSRVTFRSRDKDFPGQVLELRGEHARCSFADGRTAWVPLTALRLDGMPPLPWGVAPAAPSHSLAPSGYPAQAPSEDKPLEPWLIALIYLGLTVIPLGCTLVGAVAYSVPYFVWRKEQPNRAQQWNRHVWIAFAAGIVLWVGGSVLVGAVTGFARARENSAASTAGGSPASWKTWSAGACSIQAPANWVKNSPASNPSTELEVIDPREDKLVMLLQEDVDDFDPRMTIEEYSDKSLSDTLRALAHEGTSMVKVGAYDAQRQVHSGLVDGVKLSYARYVFRSRSHFHQIIAISRMRTFASEEPLLTRIVESARCGDYQPGGTAL